MQGYGSEKEHQQRQFVARSAETERGGARERAAPLTPTLAVVQSVHAHLGNSLLAGSLAGGDSAVGALGASAVAMGIAGIPGASAVPGTASLTAMRAVLAASRAGGLNPTSAMTRVSQGGGEQLPDPVRARMEAAFGRELSGVRIHRDAGAARASDAIAARAFTVEQDIFFGPGEYAPGTPAGDRLLAHELTHALQHEDGRLPTPTGEGLEVSSPTDRHEREATSMEDRVLSALPSAAEVTAPDAGLGAGVLVDAAPSAALASREAKKPTGTKPGGESKKDLKSPRNKALAARLRKLYPSGIPVVLTQRYNPGSGYDTTSLGWTGSKGLLTPYARRDVHGQYIRAVNAVKGAKDEAAYTAALNKKLGFPKFKRFQADLKKAGGDAGKLAARYERSKAGTRLFKKTLSAYYSDLKAVRNGKAHDKKKAPLFPDDPKPLVDKAAKATHKNNNEIHRGADGVSKQTAAVGVDGAGNVTIGGEGTAFRTEGEIGSQVAAISNGVKALLDATPPEGSGQSGGKSKQGSQTHLVRSLTISAHGSGGSAIEVRKKNKKGGYDETWIGRDSLKGIAAAIAPYVTNNIAVALYACSTAGDPDTKKGQPKSQDGSLSFASTLRQELKKLGKTDAVVMGHMVAAHTISNDTCRFFLNRDDNKGIAIKAREVFDDAFATEVRTKAMEALLTAEERQKLGKKAARLDRRLKTALKKGASWTTNKPAQQSLKGALRRFFCQEAFKHTPASKKNLDRASLLTELQKNMKAAWNSEGYADYILPKINGVRKQGKLRPLSAWPGPKDATGKKGVKKPASDDPRDKNKKKKTADADDTAPKKDQDVASLGPVQEPSPEDGLNDSDADLAGVTEFTGEDEVA